jgi:hypothetical protein
LKELRSLRKTLCKILKIMRFKKASNVSCLKSHLSSLCYLKCLKTKYKSKTFVFFVHEKWDMKRCVTRYNWSLIIACPVLEVRKNSFSFFQTLLRVSDISDTHETAY